MDDADRAMSIDELAHKRYQQRMARVSHAHHAAPIHPYCTDCGEAIEPARIQLFPYALRCVGCQTVFERK